MIKGFKDKETEKIFYRLHSIKLPINLLRPALRKLRMLHRSTSIQDLRCPPSNHLELLKGDRKGQYSIRINKKWRICFYWEESNAYEVEITNYHK